MYEGFSIASAIVTTFLRRFFRTISLNCLITHLHRGSTWSDAWFVFFFFSVQPKFWLTVQHNTVCEIGQIRLIIVFSPGRFAGYAWPEITRIYDGETRSPWNSFRPTSIKLPGINKYDATLFDLNVWYFVDEKIVARNERLRIKSFARKGYYFYQTISYLLSYLIVNL